MNEVVQADPDLNQWFLANTPMGSWAEPEEVAYGELFLASHESSFMTRLLLGLDGTVAPVP